MRAWIVVVAGLIAMPSLAAAKPCPDDVAKKMVALYGDPDLDSKRVEIRACVWGKFGGEGWLVYHVVPWPDGSKAETAPSGGIAFVKASDGRVVASQQTGGVAVKIDARVIDLDGDGVDELVAIYPTYDPLSPLNGDVLAVSRVKGMSVETSWKMISSGGMGVECKGKLAEVRAAGKKKQLVVTVKETSRPKRDDNPDAPPPAECELGAGRHVFNYVNGELTESK